MNEQVKSAAVIQRSTSSLAEEIETSVEQLNPSLSGYLESVGLPTEGILTPVGERSVVIQQFEGALAPLDVNERDKAVYLSKFALAISIGLFDAALNYLWDETIVALRKTVASFDLSYFFDVAEKREKYREKLQDVDDLEKLGELGLVDTCAHVGILTEVNRERLRHVNYMRNHASAAHPNESEVSGHEMVSWLTNCLKYAITARPDVAALEIKRLLNNIRQVAIPATDVGPIIQEISRLPHPAIDDLLWTLFAIFVDPHTVETAKENVREVVPSVWKIATEDRKYEVAARHAYFLKHGDQDRKKAAEEFLRKVDGLRYRTEEILVADLLERLRTLRRVHHGTNNFYNEWPHALALDDTVPQGGDIPRAARKEWVSVISQCYIGNGLGYRYGVDENALPHYQKYVDRFGDTEIEEFVRLFVDTDFVVDLHLSKAESRAKELATRLKSQTQNLFIQRALEVLISTPQGTLKKVSNVTDYKSAVGDLPSIG